MLQRLQMPGRSTLGRSRRISGSYKAELDFAADSAKDSKPRQEKKIEDALNERSKHISKPSASQPLFYKAPDKTKSS